MTPRGREDIINQIHDHQKVISSIYDDGTIPQTLDSIVELIINAFNQGNRVWFCGNGGSAADAQHLASELSGKFYLDRKALPAEALHTNGSFITAVANDYSFDHIYSRALEAHAHSEDVLIMLSTSGISPNVVNALKTARTLKVTSVAITGVAENSLSSESDYSIKIPSTDTPRIQEAMMLIGHIICCEIEKRMFA